MMPDAPVYGVMAEFATAQEVLAAARQARAAGYRRLEAYTPYPVEGLAAELGEGRSAIPFLVLIAGLIGAGAGFLMQYWTIGVNYPLNVGGRPINSWPVYIPITFEVMVLVASFTALFGMLYLSGLPRLHRPVFNVPRFTLASQDRFFLCVEAADPRFDREETKRFLAGLTPAEVIEVPY
jgi:hypothetical protein